MAGGGGDAWARALGLPPPGARLARQLAMVRPTSTSSTPTPDRPDQPTATQLKDGQLFIIALMGQLVLRAFLGSVNPD
jgi:hypothetical protein